MEYIIFVAFAVLLFATIIIKGYLDYKKQEKSFVEELYKNYGKMPQKEYKLERFRNISHYFEKHKDGFYIDDITWNDLNMDEVYKKIDTTFSAAGEEYLYYTLRTPSFDKQELIRKEELISYFRNHEKERVTCQFLFHKLGYTGKYSIYDYLDYLDDLGNRKNGKHYLALLLIAVGIIVLFINLPIGLLILCCSFIVNIISYFKVKNEIDPYITSFSYIFRLLESVDQLRKVNIPVLEEEWKELGRSSSALNRFKNGSFLIMSPGRVSASGNPLEILLDYLRMVFHLDLIQFNRMLSEVRKHISDIDHMISVIGQIETIIAIGAFRERFGSTCVPQFTEEKRIEARGMYHPLIKKPVKNEIETDKSVLITGSNASGKSTFLKTVAINCILAQTIHTCMADCFKASMFRVCSSMALRDDIEGGESYYIVEIKALKRIMDELRTEGAPVLCLVDEVLRGTNTVERIAASVQILRSLGIHKCLCFAATHDIELTQLLKGEYSNYHFEEKIEDNDISFSYKIISGRAKTRNAIKLLGIMGYSEEIVSKAEKMTEDFLKTGNWEESLS